MNKQLVPIITNKRQEVAVSKQRFSYKDFEQEPLFSRKCNSLLRKMNDEQLSIIAEIKRKSPSAGIIHQTLNVHDWVKRYEAGGAAALSILTDNVFFGGGIEDVKVARAETDLPILRKEFIIDEFQLFESKAIGADIVLLIAEVLDKEQIRDFSIIAKALGMEVLLEIHDFQNCAKLNENVTFLGVNNRDLDAQRTDVNHCLTLAPFLPALPKIAESGIRTEEELDQIQQAGYQGALIGEALLKNKGALFQKTQAHES